MFLWRVGAAFGSGDEGDGGAGVTTCTIVLNTGSYYNALHLVKHSEKFKNHCLVTGHPLPAIRVHSIVHSSVFPSCAPLAA